jgi:hypothetical protein
MSISRRSAGLLVSTVTVLALALLAILPVTSALAFPDIGNLHPYFGSIGDLSARGILRGYANGSFDPDSLVTRQQFAKMIVLSLKLPVTEDDQSRFTDVPSGPDPADPLYPGHYIAVAAENYIATGYDATHFGPGDNIRRAQLLTMVVRAIRGLSTLQLAGPDSAYYAGGGILASFADATHGANVHVAEFNGLLDGITPQGWDPYGYATRGEAAQILDNMIWKTNRHQVQMKADGTGDYEGLEDAAAWVRRGATINLAAGAYSVDGPLDLKSGVNVQGGGVDETVLSMAAESSPTGLLTGQDVQGLAIRDLTITSPAASGSVFALWFSDYSDVTIERVKVLNCMYALKADIRGTGLVVRDFTARACGQIYISNLTGGLFERLDLEMVSDRFTDSALHALYIAANNHNLVFNTVRAAGGSGWTVQLYHSGSPSTDISFHGLTVEGRVAVVVGDGFSNVSFENVIATATTGDAPVFDISDGPVSVDGFVASGGAALVGGETSKTVTFRNGVYSGPRLIVDPANLPNLVLENVN